MVLVRIKNVSKFTFYLGLLSFIILIGTTVYGLFNHSLSTVELIGDLMMIAIMGTCLFNLIERK